MSSKQNRTFLFYLSLFWQFFSISAFTLGGGYVMVAIMQQNFVEKKKYLELDKFTYLLASAQLLPGPIALTSSIFIGNEIAGFWGSVIGILGTTTPPFFAIYLVYLLISLLDTKLVDYFMVGVKAATVAAILQFLIKILKSKRYDLLSYILLGAFVIVGFFLNISPILLLLCGSLIFLIIKFFKIRYF